MAPGFRTRITEPFGVNLTLSNRPEANRAVTRWLDIALAHGVRLFETAGYGPTRSSAHCTRPAPR